jgi:hypothetical protein
MSLFLRNSLYVLVFILVGLLMVTLVKHPALMGSDSADTGNNVGIGPHEGLPEGHFLRVDTDNTKAGDSALEALTDYPASRNIYVANRDKRIAAEVKRGLQNPGGILADTNIETARGLLVGKNAIKFPAAATRLEVYLSSPSFGSSDESTARTPPPDYLTLIVAGRSYSVPFGKLFVLKIPSSKDVTVVVPLDEYSYSLGELRAYK